MSRAWISNAVRVIEADFNRSADTHLIPLPLPALPGVQVYLKDESSHPTGSLKHRLARSLFLYALANGWIREGTTIVEASSGSTAISEAYFARLLGLPFVAVMPRATSPGVRRRSTTPRRGWRRRAAATTWTSSPTRSAPPTGAATTTSPSRCSRR
jgi:threonine dehydratase